MVELRDFSIGFKNKELIKDVSTLFPPASLNALIGRNGSGKSTLLRAICGLKEDYSGDILIDGENIRKIPQARLAHKLAYVNTQRPRMSNLKCIDIVKLGRTPYTSWHGKLSPSDNDKIEIALKLVNMQDYAFRYFNTLSDGESEKIMIARAIAQDTGIIILDEPTSFLDLPTRYDLVGLLKNLSEKEGKTILYSTHELDIALKLSDNVALLESPCLINLPAAEMKAFLKENHHPFGIII